MQSFNQNDEIEKKVVDVLLPYMEQISDEKDLFFDEAYECYKLGDVLFDLDRSPLADAIQKDFFRTGFYAIHQLFTRPGTFEFYLDVFRAIFGSDVVVEFDIPSPGILNINIEVLELALDLLQARRIEGGIYVYYDLITEGGDNIVAQVPRGPKTQSAIDAVMVELVPQGISVNTTLVIA